ncbi:MAG: ATP-binding protein [Polyangiaceae bacterium]|jgi:signal transduction histidine kinase/DNA-binding response OmpR family regulator
MDQEIDFFPQRGEVARAIRIKDWEQTPLGPPATWSPSLRTVLRLMLASRYAMWMGWGPDLTFFYNDAYVRQTLGSKHPAVLGRPFREVWAEIWTELEPRIIHVLTTGEATWDEGLLLFLERSGYPEETYHTFSYSPAPGDLPGQIAGLFCVVIEETERVIGERRIALLRDLASLLGQTNSAEDVFAALDRCLTANARDIPFAIAYLFDKEYRSARLALSANVPRGHPAAPERVVVDDPAPWPLLPALTAGCPTVVELAREHAWPTGAWRRAPSHALVVPIDQGQSRPAGVFVAGVNPHRPLDASFQSFVELFVGQLAAALSNARAHEDERKRADALAEIDRAKTIFFSNVSHEFRTPLTLMLAPIEDMRAEARDAGDQERLALLHRNAQRLLKLVNTLLDFSRIEAGRSDAIYEPTDLSAMTADLASSFRAATERAGLTLLVDCPPMSEPIYVDRGMWEKIVLNLISNAFKFTLEGSIAVHVRLAGERAELEVTDTGTGIAQADIPRLFERFHRIEGARSRSHEGSGIGLALVDELVRLHGGDIAVESREGKGTTFLIQIPRGSAHLPKERLRVVRALQATSSGASAYVEEALRWTGGDADRAISMQGSETAGSPRARILVADDNADMRDYVSRLLRERWDVATVGSGDQALASIRRHPPDLVVCDVMMPGLGGFELLQVLRADPLLRSIPVILLSARAGEDETAEGLRAGADDYVVKPFTARDLLVRVASRISSARAAREANAVKENLYRHFIQAPFPVAVLRGPDHVIELANAAIVKAWGNRAGNVVGRPLLSAVPDLRGQLLVGYLDEVLRTGVAHEGVAERALLPTGPDGALEEAFYSFIYAPLLNASGTVTEGVLLSGVDVTAQVRSRQDVERARDRAQELAERLSSTAERLRAAQQAARIGIYDWDLTTNRVVWSPELYALMGLAPGSVEPSTEAWTEALYDATDREIGWRSFRDAVARRRATTETELRLRQPGGLWRWMRISGEIQYDEAGAPIRLLGAVVDIQVLKEAAEARTRALAEAERMSRAKDEFLATMSHELRTPLNAMLGWSKILKSNRRDEKKLEHGLTVIERNATTQARLVSDLLDVSRIISGKLRLAIQKVELSAVVYAAIEVVQQAADAKAIRLVVNLDPGLGMLPGDPDRLQQVIWNLLINAVKFTPPNGTVTVTAHRRDSTVSICVHDTGAGIPSEYLPYIFDRFRQIDGSTTRGQGGLGLGLAIVRHLVEAHGGAVEAHSAGPGEGAVFVVTLPIRADAHPTSAEAAEAPPRADAIGPAFSPADTLDGVRILVVDDDEDSLDLLRYILESAGAIFVGATNAQRALASVVRERFDFVVSDIGMPEMDGYRFMRHLRAQNIDIPAIALTAYARAEDAQRALEAGYHQHMAKPVDADELIASIERMLHP